MKTIKSKIKVSSTAFFALFLSISVFSQNIQISSAGNPTEPSIMMDPNNSDILVAGSNLNYFYTSSDGGATWDVNTLTSSYGVWGEKKFMGKTYDGIHRTTFVIDEDGKIEQIITKVNAKAHSQQILEAQV